MAEQRHHGPKQRATLREQKERREAQVPGLKLAFLHRLAETGMISKAAGMIGVKPATVGKWRRHDSEFDQHVKEAQAVGAMALEDEAYRRAYHGWEEPLAHQGKLTGDVVRKFSDLLLIFLLKGAYPEKYRERYEVAQKGAPKRAEDLTDEELDRRIAEAERKVHVRPTGDADADDTKPLH